MPLSVADALQKLGLPGRITNLWIKQLQEPQRHYHTLHHVESLLTHLAPEDANPEMIAAIWLHDIVYDPTRGDNEERSAEQARFDLANSSINVETVRRLIMGTKSHLADDEPQRAFNDLDLGILGADAESYDRYAEQIRREYVFVDDASYRQGRAAILRDFDSRTIYQTERWQHREAQAHANLQREITRLESVEG